MHWVWQTLVANSSLTPDPLVALRHFKLNPWSPFSNPVLREITPCFWTDTQSACFASLIFRHCNTVCWAPDRTWEAMMRVQLRLMASGTASLHRLLRAFSHVAPFVCTHRCRQLKGLINLRRCTQAFVFTPNERCNCVIVVKISIALFGMPTW